MVLNSPALLPGCLISVEPVDIHEANRWLIAWEHKLGPLNRPFRNDGWLLLVHGEPVLVATTSSIVHGPVDGYITQEVVELSRLASSGKWANRAMLRLWREVLALTWPCWPVKAAVSYSHNAMHAGTLYRNDGWRKVKSDCGSSGGGGWSRKRYATDAASGSKTLWIWDYPIERLKHLEREGS